MFRILVINPGSTSTKIAVYEDEAPLFVESRDHDTAKLSPAVMEQFELRHRLLLLQLQRLLLQIHQTLLHMLLLIHLTLILITL